MMKKSYLNLCPKYGFQMIEIELSGSAVELDVRCVIIIGVTIGVYTEAGRSRQGLRKHFFSLEL